MTRGALRFTEDQFRAHREKSDRFKVGTDQRPPEDSSRPLLPARGAPTSEAPICAAPPLNGGPLKPKRYQIEVVALCDEHGIVAPVTEHRFHALRKWEIDFAWIPQRIALEVEGGAWINGRHNRGQGFLNDMAKYNAMSLLGWKLIRCTPDKLADGVKSVRLLMLA